MLNRRDGGRGRENFGARPARQCAAVVANPAPVWEIANAAADAATVSQAISAIAATGDESDHATFVRVNAMVRPQDHEHFARLELRTP